MTGRLQNGSRRLKAAGSPEYTRAGRPTAVTTACGLLTTSWSADVETVETAIGKFTAERPLASDCQVVMFEIAGDDQLHVNVVHHLPHTAVVRGWSGPGRVPAGSVYNRRFADTPPSQIIRHIRKMVFA
jgi:hypothetical protein